MAILAIKPFRREGTSSTPTSTGVEAASETYTKGAILVANVSHRIAEAGADPTDIVGVAEQAGQNAAANTATAYFVPALPDIIFEGTLDTSASVGAGTIELTDQWVEYGLAQDNNVWYVDKSEVAAVKVLIVGLKDAAGTVQGRVLFKFLQSETIYN